MTFELHRSWELAFAISFIMNMVTLPLLLVITMGRYSRAQSVNESGKRLRLAKVGLTPKAVLTFLEHIEILRPMGVPLTVVLTKMLRVAKQKEKERTQ